MEKANLKSRYIAVAVLLLGIFFGSPVGFYVVHHDTIGYLEHAEYPISALLLPGNPEYPVKRPCFLPLVLKLIGATPTSYDTQFRILPFVHAAMVWSLISLITFGVLSAPVSRLCKGTSILFLCAFGMSQYVWPWIACILTEIYAMSSFLAVLCCIVMTSIFPRRSPLYVSLAVVGTVVGLSSRLTMAAQVIVLFCVLVVDYCSQLLRLVPKRSLFALSKVQMATASIVLALSTAWIHYTFSSLTVWPQLCYYEFVTARVLVDPQGSIILPKYIPVPQETFDDTGKAWFNTDITKNPSKVEWAKKYQKVHLRMLYEEPRMCLRMLTGIMGGVLWEMRENKLFKYMTSFTLNTPPSPEKAMPLLARWSDKLVNAPVMLINTLVGPLAVYMSPAILCAFFFFLPWTLGRMRMLLPVSYLAATFYGQILITIFFEAAEDTRHAVVGTAALAICVWVSLVALVFGSRCRRDRCAGQNSSSEETDTSAEHKSENRTGSPTVEEVSA